MMTFRQLAEWLAKGNGQVCSGNCSGIAFGYDEIEKKDDEPVPLYYKVRRWGDDEWIPPFYEVYKEDCLCLKDSNKDEKQKDDNDVKMVIQVPSTEKIYERGFQKGIKAQSEEMACCDGEQDKPNVFQQFLEKELPEDIQRRVERAAEYGESNAEYFFRAGFFLAHELEEAKKNQDGGKR